MTHSASTLAVLKQTRTWLEDEHHWRKGAYATDITGKHTVDPKSDQAAMTCLVGAFRRFMPEGEFWTTQGITEDLQDTTLECINLLFNKGGTPYSNVVDFNDAKGVGIAKIRRIVNCAIDSIENYGEGTEG